MEGYDKKNSGASRRIGAPHFCFGPMPPTFKFVPAPLTVISEWLWQETADVLCIQGKYDTRNHRFALQQSHIQHDMRKFSFPNRIIPLWNRLPDCVVLSPTLNTFKARLDKFWENQEIRYNWKADILYTGSRSNVELMFWLLYSDCTIFGVIYNGLDREVYDLRPAIYTTTTTTTTCGRLFGKQRQISYFSQGSLATLFGWFGRVFHFRCEIA